MGTFGMKMFVMKTVVVVLDYPRITFMKAFDTVLIDSIFWGAR